MKTNIELLKILKANKKLFETHACSGLCSLINKLYVNEVINKNEFIKLKKYIHNHRPKENSKHYIKRYQYNTWYWPVYKWQPRIAWINAEIKRLSKDKITKK